MNSTTLLTVSGFAAGIMIVLGGGCSNQNQASSQGSDETGGIDPDEVVERAREVTTSHVLTDAGEILAAALEAARGEDPQARLVDAKYSDGDGSLRFRSGTFKFNSPALRAAGERRTSLQVNVEGTEVERVRTVNHYWVEEADFDPDPSRAGEALLDSDFREWWDKHPGAGVTMHLRPDDDYLQYRPKESAWVWVATGSGPGVPEDYRVYIEEGSWEILGTEVRDVSAP
jgi:hypothetical protein